MVRGGPTGGCPRVYGGQVQGPKEGVVAGYRDGICHTLDPKRVWRDLRYGPLDTLVYRTVQLRGLRPQCTGCAIQFRGCEARNRGRRPVPIAHAHASQQLQLQK
jgi:uncharacterized protein (DUF2237 family)